MHTKTEKTVCTVEKEKFVSPCDTLKKAIEHNSKKGIFYWKFTNTDTGKISMLLFGTRSGYYKDEGIIFNYCPFCGVNISVVADDSEQKQEQ